MRETNHQHSDRDTRGSAQHNVTQATLTSRENRIRMRHAMHALEDALASSSPGQEAAWTTRVKTAAESLREMMHAQHEEFHAGEGLLADIIEHTPRLAPRVERLRQFHLAALKKLSDIAASAQAEEEPDDGDIAELRSKLGDVLVTIRNLQATESDLVFEAYNVDIGVGD